MRMIRQRFPNDCGIACAAMIVGCSYADARRAFPVFDADRGLRWNEMMVGLQELGVVPVLKRPMRWSYVASRDVDHPCLLKVIDVESRSGHFHWCVFDHESGFIFDPMGEIIRNYEFRHGSDRHVIKTYLEFW